MTQVLHFCYTKFIMATTKKRVNVSLSKPLEDALRKLAKRDQVPQATKAAELIRLAIELEEDIVFDQLAEERFNSIKKTLTHKEVWG